MKNLGVYISIFFFLIGGVVLTESLTMEYYSDYGPGPGLMPLWTSVLMIALSLLYLIMTLRKDIILLAKVLPKGEGLVNVLLCMGALILFMVIVPYTGFLIGSTIMLFILFKRGYKWYWSIGLSATVSIIIFWVFGILLQVPLPANEYGW